MDGSPVSWSLSSWWERLRSPFIEAECVANPCVDATMAYTFGLNGMEESGPRSETPLNQAEIGTVMATGMAVIELPGSCI